MRFSVCLFILWHVINYVYLMSLSDCVTVIKDFLHLSIYESMFFIIMKLHKLA